MIEKRPSRWRSRFRKDGSRHTPGGNDPVSNLGWPTAAPEPTAEHRRLGWVDVPAAVSRETVEEDGSEVAEGQAPGAHESGSIAEPVPTESRPAGLESFQSTSLEPGPEASEPTDSGTTGDPAAGPGGDPFSGGEGAVSSEGSAGPWRSAGFGAALRSGAHSEARSADGRAIGANIYFASSAADEQQIVEPTASVPSPVTGGAVADADGSVNVAGDGLGAVDSAPAPLPSVTFHVGVSSQIQDRDLPAGSGPVLQSGVVSPVDNDVDIVLESGPITHEVAVQDAGENHVEDPTLSATGTVVSRETDRADQGDGMGSLEDEHAVAENVRRRIQLTGRPFPKPVQTRVMTVANQKGGVGKTTTTVNVAAAMAQSGLKILVIDLDPQGNASTALGIDHHAEVPSIYDVLVDGAPLLEVVQPCTTVEGLFCAPATIDLAGAEIELVSLVARETRLQKAIRAAAELGHDYDYVLIDCPPSLGLLTVNAMVAASEVFIPIQCEYYALEGLSQLLKNIELVKAHLNPQLHVSTILLTMYDGRTRLSAQVADEVREHFPAEVLRTTVPRSVRVSEAPSFGETVMTYDPTSSGALAYLEAAGEIADRGAAGNI